MTAQPLPHPESSAIDHPLTIDEYAALGEIEHGHIELQEGSLVMSPSPTFFHMWVAFELCSMLKAQLPGHLGAVLEVDIDLALAPADQPGSARRPDLIVVKRSSVERLAAEGGMVRASDVVLVVEIVSPGSRRMDHRIKRDEYADAGIPYYWIIDFDEPVSLIECHRTEEFGYQDRGAMTGTFRTTVPCELAIDLDALRYT
jgi:Uma2 family endonuclease